MKKEYLFPPFASMKTTKIWRIVLAMAAVLSLASCSSDEVDTPTEEEKANDDVYEVFDVSFADGESQNIIECHLDTTVIYNYSYSAAMPVTYRMFDDLNDTLTISISEGNDYVSRLNLQGPIHFPSHLTDGKPVFNSTRPILVPIIQSQAIVKSDLLYTSSTLLHPRTFLKYTGTYYCIVNSYAFTAYYKGQTTGEMVCIKGRFRRSEPTIAPINSDFPTAYAEIHPIP